MEEGKGRKENNAHCGARAHAQKVGNRGKGENGDAGERGKKETKVDGEIVRERSKIEESINEALDELKRRGEVEKGYMKTIDGTIVEMEIRENVWVVGDRVEVLGPFCYAGQDEEILYGIQGSIVEIRKGSILFEVPRSDVGGVEKHKRKFKHVVNLEVEVSPHEGIHDTMYED